MDKYANPCFVDEAEEEDDDEHELEIVDSVEIGLKINMIIMGFARIAGEIQRKFIEMIWNLNERIWNVIIDSNSFSKV
jgi:predicted translin family RNA/ssDNA-binding protein